MYLYIYMNMTHEQCFDPFIFPSYSDFLDSILLNAACSTRTHRGLNSGISHQRKGQLCATLSYMRVDVPYTQGGPSYKLVYCKII